MLNIAIDSDIIISSEIVNESFHTESKKFMEFVLGNKNKELTFFTSIFSFVELASAMNRRTKDSDKAYSLLYRITNSWKKAMD